MFDGNKIKVKENDVVIDEISGRSVDDCLKKAYEKYAEQPFSEAKKALSEEQTVEEGVDGGDEEVFGFDL